MRLIIELNILIKIHFNELMFPVVVVDASSSHHYPVAKGFPTEGQENHQVVLDFQKSIRIRFHIYDTLLVSASHCEPQSRAKPLPRRNQMKVNFVSMTNLKMSAVTQMGSECPRVF